MLLIFSALVSSSLWFVTATAFAGKVGVCAVVITYTMFVRPSVHLFPLYSLNWLTFEGPKAIENWLTGRISCGVIIRPRTAVAAEDSACGRDNAVKRAVWRRSSIEGLFYRCASASIIKVCICVLSYAGVVSTSRGTSWSFSIQFSLDTIRCVLRKWWYNLQKKQKYWGTLLQIVQ